MSTNQLMNEKTGGHQIEVGVILTCEINEDSSRLEEKFKHQLGNASLDNPVSVRKRHGARNQARHKIFVKWLIGTFPHILSECKVETTKNKSLSSKGEIDEIIGGFHILDVAGGKGELAARLSLCHELKVVLVDPRKADIARCYEETVFKSVPKKYQERLRERQTSNPSYLNQQVEASVSQLTLHFDVDMVDKNLSLKEAVQRASLIVGMHADGATEAIVKVALQYKKPFVVVPCCVFPNLFSNRFITIKEKGIMRQVPVRTHDQFCSYLSDMDEDFVIETLPFEGRNKAIWWRGR